MSRRRIVMLLERSLPFGSRILRLRNEEGGLRLDENG